jgi:hypothetical protein
VTVPVGAGNGTAVATDEVAVDGLVVVTVTVEVSAGVSLLPQDVANAATVAHVPNSPVRLAKRQCGLDLNRCRRHFVSLVRCAGNSAPRSGRRGDGPADKRFSNQPQISRFRHGETWGGPPW